MDKGWKMKTLYVFILIALCGICILFSTSAQASDTYAQYSRISQTVASGNAVFVTWDQSTGNTTYILYKKSPDGGTTFGKTLEIASNVGVAIDQRVAISQNNVYVAWSANPENFKSQIFFRKSSDGGNTFGPPSILSDPGLICSGLSNLIATGPNVYIFYNCYNQLYQEGSIVFRSSHDYGNTFENPFTIFKGRGISQQTGVSVAANGNTIHAVFQNDDDHISHPNNVMYTASHDGGASFVTPLTLSQDSMWHAFPMIASFDKHVYVIWIDYDGKDFKDLIFRKSPDDGKTFDDSIKLRETTPEFGMVSLPSLVTSGDGKIYVKWNEMSFSRNASKQTQSAMFRSSSNNGVSFEPMRNITGKQTMDLSYSAISSGTNSSLYLVWPTLIDPTFGTVGIFFEKTVDGGKTFSGAIDLNKKNAFSLQMGDPHLVTSGSNVYVTGDSAEKGRDIFFIASHDNGATFGNMKNLNDYNSIVPVKSPLAQLRDGILPQNVKCPQDLELVIRSHDHFIACVRHIGLPRFLSHGWAYGIDDIADAASKKIQDIIKIGDKIREGNGLVPVTIIEVINNAESLDSVTDWNFIPFGYNGDNRGTSWDFIPQSYPLKSGVVDLNENDIVDKSRMPENFGITLELRLYPAICNTTEKVMGEGDHPYSIPIKKGNPTAFVYSGGRGILPDSDGRYTVNFVSLFETKIEFPKGAQVISNETKSCFLEHRMDNYTKAFYTKTVFRMD